MQASSWNNKSVKVELKEDMTVDERKLSGSTGKNIIIELLCVVCPI
jgi:hypothetical protein